MATAMKANPTPLGDRLRQQFSIQCRVDFEVIANLGHGQSVHVVQDKVFDVSQSPERGVQLVTTPELYPLWFNPHPIMLPSNSTLEFRYAVFTGSKFQRWEKGRHIHRLLAEGNEVLVQDNLDTPCERYDSSGEFPTVPRLQSGQAFVPDAYCSHRALDTHTSAIPEDRVPSAPTSPTSRRPHSRVPHAHIKNVGSPPKMALRRRKSFEEHVAENTISNTDSVLVVGFQLPVRVKKVGQSKWEVTWDKEQLLCPIHGQKGGSEIPVIEAMRILWVGMVPSDEPILPGEEESVRMALQPYRCWPVFLPEDLKVVYEKYCHGTLWPIFHNVIDVYGELPTRWWNPADQDNAWTSYATANKIFSDAVVEAYHDGDMVWVHDIHLLILPSFLSRRLRRANIGLFLHSPFPSSEIFRTLSVRDALLSGMLNADHIGFHLYEYARHFLTSCRRILGLTYGPQQGGFLGVEYGGRLVNVTISHAGIQPVLLKSLMETNNFENEVERLTKMYRDKKTFCGIDKLDRLSGIQLKLLAFKEFLKQNPQYAEKVRLVQICLSDTREAVSRHNAYQQTRNDVILLTKAINERFGQGRSDDPLVQYIELHHINIEQRLAYMAVADAFVLSHVRGGAQLLPFEYSYIQEKLREKRGLDHTPGVLILSEFVGCSRVLQGGWAVNPWRKEELVEAFVQVFELDAELRIARHEKNVEYITANTTTKWAERVLIDLKKSHKKPEDVDYMGMGFGFGFRMLGMHAGFRILDVDKVVAAYRASKVRLILFDFGGTLVAEEPQNRYTKYLQEKQEAAQEIPAGTIDLLRSLCNDHRNEVFILSGKERSDLKRAFVSVNGLGLAAEHGYYYHWPKSEERRPDLESRLFGGGVGLDPDATFWETVIGTSADESWKEVTHAIMEIYTHRTDGTYIERKGSALVWQYSDADPEFGMLQAKELQDQLVQVLEHFNVDILIGKGYLEVRPEGVHKGLMVDRILSMLESRKNQNVEFVLCIGDDASDEPMFTVLQERESEIKHCFTATVGKKPSSAQYYLNDVESVMELMTSLTKVSASANRIYSMNDMSVFSTPKHSNAKGAQWGSMHHSASMSALPLHRESQGLISQTLTQYFQTLHEDEEDGIFF